MTFLRFQQFLIAFILLAATSAFAAPGDVLRTYESPAAPEAANFGSSVAGYAGMVVASAPGANGGTVYLIDPVTGEFFPLPKPAGVTYGTFGSKVLAKGAKLYVSDPDAVVSGAAGTGAVFVYGSASDSLPLVLANPSDAEDTDFALSFDANSSGEVIIGARKEGKVYIYAPGATTHRLAISASQVQADFLFGDAVAISESGKLVVGYWILFSLTQHAVLLHPNGQYIDRFHNVGGNLTVENEMLYSAHFDVIYCFDLTNAELLTSYTEATDKNLGAALHFVDGMLAVGSPSVVSTPGNNLDSIDDELVFLNPDLSFAARATRPAAEGIGSSLASLGGYLIAGAPNATDKQGKVYLMATPASGSDTTLPDLAPADLTVQPDCKSKTNKKGTKTTCKLTGTISVSNFGFVYSGKKKASITIYHSTDAILSADDRRVGKAKLAHIPAFHSAVATFKGKTKTATTGTYLIAVIDDKNKLPESSETNNQLIHGPLP